MFSCIIFSINSIVDGGNRIDADSMIRDNIDGILNAIRSVELENDSSAFVASAQHSHMKCIAQAVSLFRGFNTSQAWALKGTHIEFV